MANYIACVVMIASLILTIKSYVQLTKALKKREVDREDFIANQTKAIETLKGVAIQEHENYLLMSLRCYMLMLNREDIDAIVKIFDNKNVEYKDKKIAELNLIAIDSTIDGATKSKRMNAAIDTIA